MLNLAYQILKFKKISDINKLSKIKFKIEILVD